jgi:hypothetical protein
MICSARSLVSLTVLAGLAGIAGLAAAGCNVIVGVGDYAAGSGDDASEGSSGAGFGDDATTADAPSEAAPEGSSSGADSGPEAGPDAPNDALADGAGDAGPCFGDTSVTCSTGLGLGYTCAGSAYPSQFFSYPDVENSSCTVVGSISSATQYCCTSCVSDSTVNCSASTAGSAGYTCFGPDDPTVDSLSNLCMRQASAGGATTYCCNAGSSSGGGPDASTPCSSNYDCEGLTNGVCNATSKTCITAVGHIGDPCFFSSDCTAPGTICNDSDWCQPTSACTSDSACGAASTGAPNQCLQAGSASYCFPSCLQNSDCFIYSGDVFCVPGDMVASSIGACSESSGQLGDPCYSDSDCGTGFCGDMNACTTSCTGTGDTSCGSNSGGATNVCVYDNYEAEYECFPGCVQQFDCVEYAGGGVPSTTPTCTNSTYGSYCNEP